MAALHVLRPLPAGTEIRPLCSWICIMAVDAARFAATFDGSFHRNSVHAYGGAAAVLWGPPGPDGRRPRLDEETRPPEEECGPPAEAEAAGCALAIRVCR